MRILVAGAGYVGEAFALQARACGDTIEAWTGTEESAAGLAQKHGLSARAVDVSDAGSVRHAASLAAPPDTVLLSVSSGRGGAESYRRVYENGARHLVAAFPRARLIFTGSTSVYAQTAGEWVDEDSPAEPDRETGRILLEAESVVRAAGGTVARLAGIYGPGRSVLLRRFLAGEAVLEGDGLRWINQAHRDDIVSALQLLCARDDTAGQVYNVGDDRPLTQRECYDWLAAHFQRPLPPPAPPDYDRKRGWTHKRVANARLRALGWSPRFPSFLAAVEAGLEAG